MSFPSLSAVPKMDYKDYGRAEEKNDDKKTYFLMTKMNFQTDFKKIPKFQGRD